MFELNGWRVRPLICYDLRFPVWSRDAQDTDLLLYTANWPGARRLHWNRLLPARAIENLCYVAAVNRVGSDGKGFAYTGDSRPGFPWREPVERGRSGRRVQGNAQRGRPASLSHTVSSGSGCGLF